MTRSEYYDELRRLAREVREAHGVAGTKVTLTDMRRIYKAHGIRIVYWKHRMKVARGVYTNDADGPCVMVDGTLPAEQRLFTLAHELKHFLVEPDGRRNAAAREDGDPLEIGAEVFAAELILPDAAFREAMAALGVEPGACGAADLVRLKRHTRTPLSYAGLVKKAVFLGFAAKGSLPAAGWKRLEVQLFGEPAYRRHQRPA